MTTMAALLVVAATAGVPATRAVVVGADGRVAAQPAAGLTADALAGADHVWAWADGAAPIGCAPRADVLAALPPGSAARVAVLPIGPGPPPEGLDVVAAPVAMWEEVPEGLLPRVPLAEDWTATVRLTPGVPFRLCVRGGGLASSWLDTKTAGAIPRFEVEPAQARTIRVEDHEGHPLEHASARLFRVPDRPRDGGPAVAVFDVSEGLLRLPELPSSSLMLTILAGGASPTVVRDLTQEAVVLPPGARLRGTATDDEGRPLAGVHAEVEYFFSRSLPWLMVRGAGSDAEGSFEVDGLPLAELALTVTAAGFVPERRRIDVDVADVDLGVVQMRRAVSLPVTVVDEGGAPVPEARVALAAGDPVTTDEQGGARVEGIDPEHGSELTVGADGFLGRTLRVEPPLGERLVVRLRRAFAVSGTAVCGDEPASGGTLEVHAGNRVGLRDLEGDGRFSASLEPAKEYSLVLRPRGCTARTLTLVPGAPGEVRDLGAVVCQRGGAVRFQVVEADGAPAAGVRVWAPRPSQGGPLLAWAHGELAESTSDEEGWVTVAGLPAGPVLLRGEPRERARFYLETEMPADGTVELPAVTLERGREVRVEVEPVDGADQARLDLRRSWLDFDQLAAEVKRGRAVFEHVPSGTIGLTLWREGAEVYEEDLDVEVRADPLEVACELEEVRVHGRATVGGAPASGVLSFHRQGADVAGVVLNTASPAGLRQQQAFGAGPGTVTVVLDDDGTFTTDRLGRGSWRVSLHAAGGTSFPERDAIVDGDDVELILDFPGIGLSGRVVDTDGAGLARATVRELRSNVTTLSGGDGRFSLAGLSPGQAELVARYRAESSEVTTVSLEAGRSPEPVTLVVGGGERREVVVQVDGGSAAGSLVFLESDRGAVSLVSADGTGTARFPLQHPLPGRVRAAAQVAGAWVLGAWVAVANDMDPIVLAASCTGVLELETDRDDPVPVSVLAPGGWNLRTVLGFLGVRFEVAAGRPLLVSGLPAGTYQASAAGRSVTASVRCGDATSVVF